MALTSGDLLQIIDTQVYLTQQMLNVYYYRYTGISSGYVDPYNALLDQFETDIVGNVLEIQMSDVAHTSREIRNLTNGLDFAIHTEVLNGLLSSATHQEQPSFLSAGFLLQRGSLVTRNGYKRFGGLSETDVVGNDWVGETTRLDDIAAALSMDITGESSVTMIPVIVKRPIDPPVATYLYSEIVSASFRGLGTQNSRKPGRGV